MNNPADQPDPAEHPVGESPSEHPDVGPELATDAAAHTDPAADSTATARADTEADSAETSIAAALDADAAPDAAPDADADADAGADAAPDPGPGPGDDPADDPDVGFTLDPTPPAPQADPASRATELTREIARALAAAAPAGWQRLTALFALTAAAELGQVFYIDEDGHSIGAQPSTELLELVRSQRHEAAQLGDGPWWRLLLTLGAGGELEVDYDYGDEPFPQDQLFPPQAYAEDLELYPRESLPVWLAAHLGHADRQSRSPGDAAAQARADRARDIRGELADRELPEFPLMWARWAVLSAAFVAARSQWGPRILPSLGMFEGSRRSGATLYALPGGRAVLSGGVWNAPELDAAYNADKDLPELYAGAPEWVANPVLNARASTGLLSFCYWWDSGHWYRGESPGAQGIAEAVPGFWTVDTVVDVVLRLITAEPGESERRAVAALLSAAEVGVATRDTLVEVFGDDGFFDIDSAFYQLTLAGVALALPEPMPQEQALARVRSHLAGSGTDTAGYPPQELVAERISVGWMVYVPVPPDEIAVGRTIFYLADDGVLEQSSSSVAPSDYIAEFEQRFQQRHRSVDY
ncbi:hypothetical protein [Nocardia cyriacigeorgica]|uniref:Uncharacterized protein n=1 Tax=Nocardia cyriacigeorgica (strain GUH-2) TaxID=1127134 RepID=H6QZY6_NOCCG|nr:hypothetical protein [Nocardia cyriacigeorgica]BDT85069.1 hypothetical protein FMUAM8_08330 [Nocardia cyriacigeorgica]CCF61651.1 conserved protein of unknown function [Nocardia cyriacigeorgica GUH-2]